METWAKGAVEKIVMMLKASMCEAEDGPAAAQRAGLNEKKKQTSVKLKAGRVAGPEKRKPVNGLSGCGEAFYLYTLSYVSCFYVGFMFLLLNYRIGIQKLSSEEKENQGRTPTSNEAG